MKSRSIGWIGSLVIGCLMAVGPARAALIAYEPFATGAGAYTVGQIDNQNPTVTGFSGAWSIDPTQSGYNGGTVSATGLTYPGLPTTGGMYVADHSRWYRTLAAPFDNTTSGTYWMSYLYQSTANGGNFQAFETYTTGANPGTDATRKYNIANGSAGWPNNGYFTVNADNPAKNVAPANTSVNLFVIKMDFVAGGNDTFTVWMNPSLAAEPTGGLAWTTDLSWTYTGIFDADTTGAVNFDEIRIGDTFNDVIGVIPEPATGLLLSVGAVALGLIRRKLRG